VKIVLCILASLYVVPVLGGEIPRQNFKETIVSNNKPDSTEEELFKYTPPTHPRYEIGLVGLLLKTALVLCLMGGVLYLVVRFFVRGRAFFNQEGGLFHVIGTHALAPNKYMQLIEMGDSLFVIGVTENSINLLKEIKEKETIDLIKTQASRFYGKREMGFTFHLRKFLSRFQTERVIDEGVDGERKIAFLKHQRSRLRRLDQSQ
jgi:flagellar protein FliO/FliZ